MNRIPSTGPKSKLSANSSRGLCLCRGGKIDQPERDAVKENLQRLYLKIRLNLAIIHVK